MRAAESNQKIAELRPSIPSGLNLAWRSGIMSYDFCLFWYIHTIFILFRFYFSLLFLFAFDIDTSLRRDASSLDPLEEITGNREATYDDSPRGQHPRPEKDPRQ